MSPPRARRAPQWPSVGNRASMPVPPHRVAGGSEHAVTNGPLIPPLRHHPRRGFFGAAPTRRAYPVAASRGVACVPLDSRTPPVTALTTVTKPRRHARVSARWLARWLEERHQAAIDEAAV